MTNLQGAVVLGVGATGGLGSRIADQLEGEGPLLPGPRSLMGTTCVNPL
ncbi:hypothetical protein [Nesterenkonia haasae]|nr:hypothetical protein [Nesterenkonia haasae]